MAPLSAAGGEKVLHHQGQACPTPPGIDVIMTQAHVPLPGKDLVMTDGGAGRKEGAVEL